MVKIKLAQTGKRNKRSYRIVAIEEGKRRNGRAIEILGFYNPLVTPPHIVVKKDRVEWWVSHGAQLTEGTAKILGNPA